MAATKATKAYGLVKEVASPDASEGLKRERSILLLWFLRNVVGMDDLDAYQYVCDGTDDRGVDGMYVESGSGDDEMETLVLLQAKYPESPKWVGEPDIAAFVGYAGNFKSAAAVKSLLAGNQLEPELRELITNLKVVNKLEQQKLRVRLVFVTAGVLEKKARQLVKSTNEPRRDYLTVWDVLDLAPMCEAVLSPKPVDSKVQLTVPAEHRFEVPSGDRKQVVAAVRAEEIVDWPGIKDRTLFDLNVRRELRPNKVSKGLRSALEKTADHPNFLAFHNGLTVVCDEIELSEAGIAISGISVVNGAQSVLALKDREDVLTPDLRLVVKLIEIGKHRQVAREVAWRSNSQNQVNSRNLKAQSGAQLRLTQDFVRRYPDYTYETRPDASEKSSGIVIQNDRAAQLLCAVYVQKPWLAVKVLSLFEDENYTQIFKPDVLAPQVILVDLMDRCVKNMSHAIPEEYLKAKKLTQLVMVYLVGELLRTSPSLSLILEDPELALKDPIALQETLEDLALHAAGTLAMRAERHLSKKTYDDFKVDFKGQRQLLDLGSEARQQYAYAMRTARTHRR